MCGSARKRQPRREAGTQSQQGPRGRLGCRRGFRDPSEILFLCAMVPGERCPPRPALGHPRLGLGRTTGGSAVAVESTILIADPDAESRKFLRRLLNAQGHIVVTVQDGKEFQKVVETEQPDLIMLDAAMPDGGGVTMARR